MSGVHTSVFGPKLAAILGVDIKRVTSMTIHVDAADLVKVDVKMIVLREDQQPILDALSGYELVPKGSPMEATVTVTRDAGVDWPKPGQL